MGLAMGGRLRRVWADPEENMYPGSLIYAAYVRTHTHTHTTVDLWSPASMARRHLQKYPSVSLRTPPHSHLPPFGLQADLAELCLEKRKMSLSVFQIFGAC